MTRCLTPTVRSEAGTRRTINTGVDATRIRRMWTLCTMPNIAKYVIRLDPPYEMNGIGKPGHRHDPERHPDVLEDLPESAS